MHLNASCHCGAVRFSVTAYAPVPYLRCYCSICRKTAGGGGYAINLGARADTLRVEGEDAISVFRARTDGTESPAERRFCARCGSALWVWDPRWPELVHPFASAVDTPLPEPPESEHMMLELEGELGARRGARAGEASSRVPVAIPGGMAPRPRAPRRQLTGAGAAPAAEGTHLPPAPARAPPLRFGAAALRVRRGPELPESTADAIRDSATVTK